VIITPLCRRGSLAVLALSAGLVGCAGPAAAAGVSAAGPGPGLAMTGACPGLAGGLPAPPGTSRRTAGALSAPPGTSCGTAGAFPALPGACCGRGAPPRTYGDRRLPGAYRPGAAGARYAVPR
jgi:hypothetical protein